MKESNGRVLKVAAIQMTTDSADKEVNVKKILDLIDEAAKTQPNLIVLPELCTTPYWCTNKDYRYFDWAENIPGPTVEAIGQKARQHSCCIILPLFERGKVKGEFYNSAAVVGPDGKIISGTLPDGTRVKCYRKVHLPTLESPPVHLDEKFFFRPGQGFPTFVTPEAVIGILICWDRCFPEGWRALALQGAEIIVMSSALLSWAPNKGVSREEQFISEMRTRALENQVFVVGCNKCGVESFTGTEIRFFGNSCAIDPYGNVLSLASSTDPIQLYTTLDLDKIKEARLTLPFYRDRRPELYSIVSESR